MTSDEFNRIWDAAMRSSDEPQDVAAAAAFGLTDDAKRLWGITPDKAARMEEFKARIREEIA